MEQVFQTGRSFWRTMLLQGGSTTIPRWTLEPRQGVAVHECPVPQRLGEALCALAERLAVPLSSVVLGAHAVVLSALSGDRDVTTAYVPEVGDEPLPCRVSTAGRTWRELVRDAHRAESQVLSHRFVPLEDLRAELGVEGPSSEAVFDPTGTGVLPPDAVLTVVLDQRGTQLMLRVRYRTESVDAGYAARVAGYHLRALTLAAADPEAEHGRQSLLSDDELRLQLEGLAGPRGELPDHRAHEVFEQRVREHPDVVAAVCGTEQWTYRQVNGRANRLARALVARGVRSEDVVAVVMERNLDWLAAVLAVFKAGGAYLPVEPHFPAERIAATLRRAGCRLVLSEAGSTATLDRALDALSGVERLLVGAGYAEQDADDDLRVPVGQDQLAYVYFTSGSTGEPKGAMCEHAGFLNHLYAKIDDLEIGAGQVVAQTAPQCFDISLWQLMSALLVGGRTLLVEQEAVLDVERFVDRLVTGRVAVLQVVPSYLEVVVSYLEHHPRDLPDLRYVSVTGEAVRRELVKRWFAVQPRVRVVNAYGLTETSDDTNHEVLDRVPDGDRVPLGRCINNVRVYVVDDELRPVPLGAPGLIVFSGVCVGRGYLNDPERTREAFLADPYRDGERLYRGGDYGRWLPGGKLDFLGRRDGQVKVSGFRIEIGDVESAVLRVPGIRDGAVVVADEPGRPKRLVAFCTGPAARDVEGVRARVAESLPPYMVPSEFRSCDTLPLTANGKVDRKLLAFLAATSIGPDGADTDHHAPSTATERRLAAAWAEVLGIPEEQVSRHDSFFELGGTSLSAVRLAIRLDGAVSLKNLNRCPVLADLAQLVDGAADFHSPKPS
jgi:amino acid adenylation domain-containing protein